MYRHNFFSLNSQYGKSIKDQAVDFGISGWKDIARLITLNGGNENRLQSAIRHWLASKSHRRNIFGKTWVETGIGIAVSQEETCYITVGFISK